MYCARHALKNVGFKLDKGGISYMLERLKITDDMKLDEFSWVYVDRPP